MQLKKDKTRDVNKVAGERLGRTTTAIATIRTKTEYKQAERQVKKEEEEHNKKGAQQGGKESRGQNVRSAQELTDNAQELTGEAQELMDDAQELTGEEQDSNSTPVNIKRQLPMVPPTPFEENLPLSQMLLKQQDLNITTTPTVRRKLPETPLDGTSKLSYPFEQLQTPVRVSLQGVNRVSTTQHTPQQESP